jgi:trehalose synthase-fused probable maltokinase
MTPDVRQLVCRIPEDALREFVTGQRWFGAKSRELAHLRMWDAPVARTIEPYLALALVEVRFPEGTHETYHLPVGLRTASEGWSDGVITEVEGVTVYDALADPQLTREVVHRIRSQQPVNFDNGSVEFQLVEGAPTDVSLTSARAMGAEQSNTSIVFDEAVVLKVYRRLEAGVNPELELLRFLTARSFDGIPALQGWAAYIGHPLEATLAILQEYIQSEGDGWDVAMELLARDADAFVERARPLGELTGRMHTVLASDATDSAFAPESPSTEALALLTASVDDEIEQVFLDLPEGNPELDPIRGRGEEVRDRLRMLSVAGSVGLVIRHHGDYHLGQVLWTGERWVVLDFEGEPARPLAERRRKRSPLRDVAGMLRSFAYVASAAQITKGIEPPADWEARCRREFMDGYVEEVDSSLIPNGPALDRVLQIFELEKAVYELRYELDNRPDWVRIPVAGIVRILDEESA